MKFASQLECYLKETIGRLIFKNINRDQFHCSINISFNLLSTYNFLFVSTSQYIVNYDKKFDISYNFMNIFGAFSENVGKEKSYTYSGIVILHINFNYKRCPIFDI